MDDSSFQEIVDEVFLEIEDKVDELNDDVDVDSSGGVLTLTFPNGTSVILSRQISSHEIWIAAKSGGFHLAFDEQVWSCASTGEDLKSLLDRVFVEQGSSSPFS